MRNEFEETKSIQLLISLLFIAGIMFSGCSSDTSEVEMSDPKQVYTLIAEQDETNWDLVALGDSTPTGYGVGSHNSYIYLFAGYIEEDLGVDVEVHSWATNTTRRVEGWVEEVQTNQELREDLKSAEVITIWLGWHDVIPSTGLGRGGPCYPQDNVVDLDCLREVTDPMQKGFDELLAEIVDLANPAETLILIADVGIPNRFLARWNEYGTLATLKIHAYEVWRDYIIQAAGDHKVHVVNTYEVINGPNGDHEIDPEYLQSDGLHFSEEGHELLAETHFKLCSEEASP